MKFRIEEKLLYVTEYTQEEISWLDNKLTWEDEDGKKEKLLYKTESGVPYSFWGLYYLIKDYLNCPYLLELENPINEVYAPINISNNILENITLMDFQIAAVKKSITLKKGILSITTGGGKTEIILAVIKYLLDNKLIKSCVIVVPSVGLADQLLERAFRRGFNQNEISSLHSNSKHNGSAVLVGVVNSLNNSLNGPKSDLKSFIETADCLIYDECHHFKASTFARIALDTNPKYCLMYSGSPFSSKVITESPGDTLLFCLAGRVIFTIGQKYLVELGLIAEPIVHYKEIPGKNSRFGRYDTIYKNYIINNGLRNSIIASYTNKFVNLGFSTLILVQRLDHAKILMEMLRHLKIICVFGGSTGLQINEFGQVEDCPIEYNMFRSNFEAGVWDVVIGSQVIDEGFDIPSIGAVILAGAGKSRVKLLQRIGRGLRRKKIGRNAVYILDFLDKTHIFLQSQYKKRRLLVEEIEATIVDNEQQFLIKMIEHSKELKELK